MTNIFFTSDFHLFHKNILSFTGRPFKDLEAMHTKLISNFNEVVAPEDVTYFLGDMGTGTTEEMRSVIDRLKGTKILIIGNHDHNLSRSYSYGFDVVLNSASMIVAKTLLTLSHYPFKDVKREDISAMGRVEGNEKAPWHGSWRKTAKHALPSHNGFHLHGHIHSPNKGQSVRLLDNQLDVGVDANNLKPVSLKTVTKEINRYISRTEHNT